MSEKHWLYKTIEMFIMHFIEDAVIKVSENMGLYSALFYAREVINGGNSTFLMLSHELQMDEEAYRVAAEGYGDTLQQVRLVVKTKHGEMSFLLLVLGNDWIEYHKKMETLLKDLYVLRKWRSNEDGPIKLTDAVRHHCCTVTDIGFTPRDELRVLSINDEFCSYDISTN